MDNMTKIETGRTALGIELGSTRIKAILVDENGAVLSTGIHDWENSLVDGVWTYSLEEIHAGLRGCYTSLRQNVLSQYGVALRRVGAMGISAMMHGYMALDADGHQVSPFQTWRNTNTQAAADALTEALHFNIPLRWTAAHLYQRCLDKEPHVAQLDFVNTLSGYIHYLLTGQRCIGVGDAAGMFPVDPLTMDYDAAMTATFDKMLAEAGCPKTMRQLFPRVLVAGDNAGCLTEAGAAFLDESGTLLPGIPLCPPEGDAGTGMVATNSVAPRTGNVSAGTSTFAMIVLERPLQGLYREIDMVATPSGLPCAMSHANNGTSDLNAWVEIFAQFSQLMGQSVDRGQLFEKLYTHALTGDSDCGGLMSYGYYSGENITMINEGRLAFLRCPDSNFTLANFMRSHLYTSLAAVKLGLDILTKEEQVKIDRVTGHGGFFKTPVVGQRCLAAAMEAPVTVMATASEGGAWGMALLAAYLLWGKEDGPLENFLDSRIFPQLQGDTLAPTDEDMAGFATFMERYSACLDVERAAIECMQW